MLYIAPLTPTHFTLVVLLASSASAASRAREECSASGLDSDHVREEFARLPGTPQSFVVAKWCLIIFLGRNY